MNGQTPRSAAYHRRKWLESLFSPPVVTPVAAVGGSTSGACLGKSALDTLPGPAGWVPGLPSRVVADGEPRLWGVSS